MRFTNPAAKVTASGTGCTFSDGTVTFREGAALRKRKLYTFNDGENVVRFKMMKGVLYIYEVLPVFQVEEKVK